MHLTNLIKQSQEIQQMASNDERTRQMITARKTQRRNQDKDQETPKRANPKAKSETFKFTSTAVKDDEVKDGSDDGNPETKHEPKGKRGRPSNIRRTIEKNNPLHDTEKDENRNRTHWRRATKGYLVDQLAKYGSKYTTPEVTNAKLTQKQLAQTMI